ncbi:MAG: CxxC-x17-CxxC domain-containing protein [bacterium]
MFNQNFEDQQLQCADCGQTFVFSAEDQEYYHQKRYSTPKRCPVCRANRKMGDSRGGGRSGGGSRSGGGGGGYNNKPRFKVICDGCGCETTVPFEPKSDRPVYCSNCYKNNY